jgi:hypothetical protein
LISLVWQSRRGVGTIAVKSEPNPRLQNTQDVKQIIAAKTSPLLSFNPESLQRARGEGVFGN